MRTFSFVNQSCYRRQEEIAMTKRFLFVNGYSEESDLAKTDLAFLFTCAFCQSRVADMLNEIKRIGAIIKEECELVVGSCLPVTDKTHLEEVFSGKTITPTDFSALDLLPGITVKFAEMLKRFGGNASCARLAVPLFLRADRPDQPLGEAHSKAEAKQSLGIFISSGCRRKCSYCAIRFATGPLRSKPLDVVTRSFSEGLDQACRQFEIYADSIGDYGLDIGTNLGELFSWLLDSDREFSVGIHDLHPQAFEKFYGELLSLCQAGKVHYLYVPLQSGNERILKLMNRPCAAAALQEKLQKIGACDGVFLQTSIIIGFPSETDDEFEDTLTFLRAVHFHDVYVHFYSDMPNTESSKMADKIGKTAMLGRLDRLNTVGIKHNREKTRHEWENIPSPS